MNWSKQLIPPFIYGGRGIKDDRWPFPIPEWLKEGPVPAEDVYEKKLREYWEKQEKVKNNE